MLDIEITHAETNDTGRILAIRHAAFSAHAPSVYSEVEVKTLLDDVDELELLEMIDNRQLFVARKTTGVVGVAGWKGMHLRHVYVDPRHTRQGIATILLRHVEDDFRERTLTRHIDAGVALYAVDFYLANGYKIVERTKAWDGSEYYEMTKSFG